MVIFADQLSVSIGAVVSGAPSTITVLVVDPIFPAVSVYE